MQNEVDGRHWAGVAVLVIGLVLAGWYLMTRPAERPNTPAPAGSNPRMQDAPEYPPAPEPPTAASGPTAPAPPLPPGLAP